MTLANPPIFTGKQTFQDDNPKYERSSSSVYLPLMVEVEGVIFDMLALVDTGAPYCIFDPEVAAMLGIRHDNGIRQVLESRAGSSTGSLHRVQVTVPAEVGDSLSLEATVFVPEAWPLGSFIGYSGLLQRISFAVTPHDNQFYFGLPP